MSVRLPSWLLLAAGLSALFNPGTSILIQKHPFYSGNVSSETPGDSESGEMF
jgi:hypothetical protein